jgi:hypothetical protein
MNGRIERAIMGGAIVTVKAGLQQRLPRGRIEKPVVKAVKGMMAIKFAWGNSVLKKWT